MLFGAQAGLAVLPLMLLHLMHLMVGAGIARRYARMPAVGPGPDPLPAVAAGRNSPAATAMARRG
ncbi:hypothetical protein [Streptomyces sp. 7N604]|uniref:hypothetical protein n=1 Tax=Streptomyces sp. 7N604 TaxID=3457415 RepID=UPI003FD04DAF